MKRGTTPTLNVTIDELDNSDILGIIFLFKQIPKECAPEVLRKVYPGDAVAYDSEHDRYLISLTEEESRLFLPDQLFYMDTKITLTNGKVPNTSIEQVLATKTLFGEDEDD